LLTQFLKTIVVDVFASINYSGGREKERERRKGKTREGRKGKTRERREGEA
jgi:hypothetical protein